LRSVPQSGLDFLDGVEGDRLTAYRDSTGRWTIGRGHTGPEVVEGLTISEAQSDAYRFSDAVAAAGRIAKVVTADRIGQLGEHQWDALISFSFNLGFGTDVCPTMIRLLNAGQFDAVPAEMQLFDHARVDGKEVVVPGLYHRRAAEVALWKTADLASSIAVAQAAPVAPPPSSFTKCADTPPAPIGAKALMQSKRFLAACGALGASSLSAVVGDPGSVQDTVKSISDNLGASPLVAHSVVLQHVSGVLTAVVLVLGAAVPTLMFLKRRGLIT
jgi:lysozyme